MDRQVDRQVHSLCTGLWAHLGIHWRRQLIKSTSPLRATAMGGTPRVPIYPHPKTDYERCVEALWQTAKRISSKDVFLRVAQKEWSTNYKHNPDRLQMLITTHQDRWGQRTTSAQQTLQQFYKTVSCTSTSAPAVQSHDEVVLDVSGMAIASPQDQPTHATVDGSVDSLVSSLGVDCKRYRADEGLQGSTEFVTIITDVMSHSFAAYDAKKHQYKSLGLQRRRGS